MTEQRQPHTTAIPDALKVGLQHHQAGRLPEAERVYQRVLQIEPDNPDALHLLGVIAHQVGKNELSRQLIEQAVHRRPSDPVFLTHLGEAYGALRRFEDAVAAFDRAIALKADHADAFNSRGNALQELRRYADALSSYERALASRPDFALALNNRGNVLQRLQRHPEAIASYDAALRIKPDLAEAFSNRGNALQELGRLPEALASYDRAISIKRDYAAAHNNRGIALWKLKRHDDAVASFDHAVALNPAYAEAWSNRGAVLEHVRRYQEALVSCERALSINPSYADALNNRGNVLLGLNRHVEALESYERALTIKPGYAEALCNRGVVLQRLKRCDAALASYDQALAIRPDYAEAHYNQSLCRLLASDFERGWKQYEWRWKWRGFPSPRRDFSQPLWLGKQHLAATTILLHAEQGLGDTIQFCRYAKQVAARGARVVLEVDLALKSLLADLDGVSQVVGRGERLPAFDFHCPLLSLPLALGTRADTIPTTTPYLHASPDAVRSWQKRLGGKSAPRVGIVWSGRPMHSNDHNRSLPLSRMLALEDCEISLVSLQRDVRTEDQPILSANKHVLHLASELRDFSDTAALVSAMDLVISVDTAVAHLAGALGKTVWVLLPFAPDWRWSLSGDRSAWYPSARLFRQPAAGDWDSVIDEVRQALRVSLTATPRLRSARKAKPKRSTRRQ